MPAAAPAGGGDAVEADQADIENELELAEETCPSDSSSTSRSIPAEDDDDVPAGVWRIHGRDYDLSSWVDEHPGGSMMILLGKGTDCTILFETYHTFNEPRKRLRGFDVTPDGLKPEVVACPSPFLVDVRSMVKQYFEGASLSPKRRGRVERSAHKASVVQLLLMILLLIGEGAATYWWLTSGLLGAGFVAGFCGYLLMVNLGHDASHGALTRYPWINMLAHFAGNAPYVNGHASWSLQHVVSHHQHTNEVGVDVDAHHFPFARWHRQVAPEINGGRTCGGWHNVFWHLITYLASTISMCIVHPIHFVFVPLFWAVWCRGLPKAFRGGLNSAVSPRHGILGCPQPSFDSAFEKVAGTFARERVLLHNPLWLVGNLLIWLTSLALLLTPLALTAGWGGGIFDIYPYRPFRTAAVDNGDAETPIMCLLRWLYAAMLALAPWGASSVAFMTATQISHIQEVCQKESTLCEPCPYKRQALTSLDHSTGSRIGHFLTGGLNLQVCTPRSQNVPLRSIPARPCRLPASPAQLRCAPRSLPACFPFLHLQSVHHCMPSISLVHYPAIYPLFREVCKKHDCLPMDTGSMVFAIMSHWSYVYQLGRGDFAPGNAKTVKALSATTKKKRAVKFAHSDDVTTVTNV